MNDSFYITPDSGQIRAARALLRWSARELAQQAGVSLPTVQRIEAQEGQVNAMASTVNAIVRALSDAGVEFIKSNGGGPGVRMVKLDGGE